MQVFTRIDQIRNSLHSHRENNKRITFIPTMGALHDGHMSLIRMGQQNADITVCSIFVNPTQFNNAKDLQSYPRMLEKDVKMLEAFHCDILFAPDASEVYPEGLETRLHLKLGKLDQVMEGQFRPGHFEGMLQVVKRLLDIIQPDDLIMGQKDFQQFTLVRFMLSELGIPTKLLIAPTLREKDGLAMSSRNIRLSAEMREVAPVIFKNLEYLKSHFESMDVCDLSQEVMENLDRAGLKAEYVEIVDGDLLELVENPENHRNIVACIAAWAGEVRLIDNLYLKGGPN
ncbi:MAG: pantoate--beta-alanine ligase [Saprospiraceae bacterium]|nr:pantoate--beta-alanine ligase [Saprospiraceae bacterium]